MNTNIKNKLPKKFTGEEHYCYQWLHDCQIRGWLVDLLTKKVHDGNNEYDNLIDFAEFHGLHK